MEFLFATENLAFTVSLALLVLLVLMELGMGGGMTEFLDTLVPDLELDANGQPVGTDSLPTKLLGWLRVDRVPMLMLVGVFLGVFGVGGLLLQSLATALGFGPVPMLLAATLMLVLSLPLVRAASSIIGRFMPRDETQALSQQALVGRFAIIVLGKARRDAPAQAKLRDEFRTTHYVMVEPVQDDDEFQQGDEVLLMSRHGAHYRAVRAEVQALEHKH